MSNATIKATELVGTEISHVSLVKRGANRIPFRITKEDNSAMLDLNKIGLGLFKKAETKPEVVAAIVKSGTDLNVLATVFKAAGLEPKDFVKSEKDGVITVAKAGAEDAADAAVMRVTEDIALVVSGLQKAFSGYDFESTSFRDVLATNGFYSSLCLATDVLKDTISNILYSSEDPGAASSAISKASDDFKSYLNILTASLPVAAFKAEIAIRKAMDAGRNGTGAGFEAGLGTGTNASATLDDASNTAVNATSTEGAEALAGLAKAAVGVPDPKGFVVGDAGGFADATADSDAATARASADDKKMKLNGGTDGSTIPDGNSGIGALGGIKKEDPAKDKAKVEPVEDEEVEKGKAKKDDAVLAAIAGLQKSFETQIAAVTKTIGEVNSRVDQVATMAKKTDAALNGTVFNEADGDQPTGSLKKSEGAVIPLLDTGYTRHTA